MGALQSRIFNGVSGVRLWRPPTHTRPADGCISHLHHRLLLLLLLVLLAGVNHWGRIDREEGCFAGIDRVSVHLLACSCSRPGDAVTLMMRGYVHVPNTHADTHTRTKQRNTQAHTGTHTHTRHAQTGGQAAT